MKKIITILIAVIVVAAVLFGVTMAIKKYKENNALATAETVYEVSDNIGTVTVSESVARQMLGQYPNEILGVSKPLNKYIFKLSETRLLEKNACLVELFLTEEDSEPQATFAIIGYDCFVYDKVKGEFLLLTLSGAFSVEQPATNLDTTKTFYDEANNTQLHKIIDGFSKESLGFSKAPSEYIMVATGTSVTASDGATVYVVRMYEQDGTQTNYTCAFTEKNVYKFDTEQKQYVSVMQ